MTRTRSSVVLIGTILPCLLAASARAEFGKIINVPPDVGPTTLAGSVQLNLYDGGRLYQPLNAGQGHPSNIEINIFGGEVTRGIAAYSGTNVNVLGGYIVGLRGYDGANITIKGGLIGDVRFSRSNVSLFGADFLLNGQPVAGLDAIGDTIQLPLPEDYKLSGVLSDGSPFQFTDSSKDFYQSDLSLTLTSLPPIGLTNILSSSDPVPKGLRSGQTLTADSDVDYVQVGVGSTLDVVENGQVRFNLVGGTVNVHGGTVVRTSYVQDGSTFNVFDGTVDLFQSYPGSTVNIYGGEIGSDSFAAGTTNVFGGSFGSHFDVWNGEINVSGGTFTWGMRIFDGAVANISGGTYVTDRGLAVLMPPSICPVDWWGSCGPLVNLLSISRGERSSQVSLR
jgi:hypothetical protein